MALNKVVNFKLTHFRPMFHLWINQVVGFYHNVEKHLWKSDILSKVQVFSKSYMEKIFKMILLYSVDFFGNEPYLNKKSIISIGDTKSCFLCLTYSTRLILPGLFRDVQSIYFKKHLYWMSFSSEIIGFESTKFCHKPFSGNSRKFYTTFVF